MRFFVLFFAFLLSSSVVAQCIEDNSDNCTALGYDQPSCPFGGVACPFDTSKWHCADWQCVDGRYFDDADEQWWTDCIKTSYKGKTCYDCSCEIPTPDCQIGDMFYADKTCTKKYGDCLGKKPIGIVFMLTDEAGNITNWNDDGSIDYSATSRHGRIMHLRHLAMNTDNQFIPENPYEGNNRIPWKYTGQHSHVPYYENESTVARELKDVQGRESESYLYTGKANTIDIATSLSSSTATAAKSCYLFYLPGYDKDDPFLGQGRWYLPSVGELLHVFGLNLQQLNDDFSAGLTGETRNKVNLSLYHLNNKGVTAQVLSDSWWNGMYWASLEGKYDMYKRYAWFVYLSLSGKPSSTGHRDADSVIARPFLEF